MRKSVSFVLNNSLVRVGWFMAILAAGVTCVVAEGGAEGANVQSEHSLAADKQLPDDDYKGPVASFIKREHKIAAEVGNGVIELKYKYKNIGDQPLMVQKFVVSCGCMAGEWDGEPVEPGETGIIKAIFLTKGLRGLVRKSLHVQFFESKSVELIAEVTIPETLVYSAQTVRWGIGEKPVARVVDVRVKSKNPVRVLSAVGGGGVFSCSLKTVDEGRHYRITIIPKDTVTERVGIFHVRTDAKDPRDALQGIFALIEKSTTPSPSLKGGSQ